MQGTLRARAEAFSTEWKLLPFKLEGTRFWGMKTGRADLGSANPFASLPRMPSQGRVTQPIALAVFSAAPERAGDGFYVVARESSHSPKISSILTVRYNRGGMLSRSAHSSEEWIRLPTMPIPSMTTGFSFSGL